MIIPENAADYDDTLVNAGGSTVSQLIETYLGCELFMWLCLCVFDQLPGSAHVWLFAYLLPTQLCV